MIPGRGKKSPYLIEFSILQKIWKCVQISYTDAGKEVARSKVMDNDGKEYTLFLTPKPIKAKALDKTKMFGGQLQYLFQQVKTSSKCGKEMHADKKKLTEANTAHFRLFQQDFQSRRARQRGGRFGMRERSETVIRLERRELSLQEGTTIPEAISQAREQVEASTQMPPDATHTVSQFRAGNIGNCQSEWANITSNPQI